MTPPPPSVRGSAPAPSGVSRPVEADKDDSGIVDLAMASTSDPQAAARAQSTPLASAGLFDDEPASVRPGPVSSAPVSHAPNSAVAQQPVPSMPPMPASLPPASLAPASAAAPASVAPSSAAAVAPAAMSSASLPAKKKGSGAVIALVVGGLVAVSAAAAGGFMVLKNKAAATAPAAVAMNDAPPADVAKTTAPETAPAADPAQAAPADETATDDGADDEGTLDPNALPAADGKPKAKHVRSHASSKVAAAAKPAAKEPAKSEPKKDDGPKLSEKDLPPSPSGPAGALGDEMAKAVGANGKSAEPTPAAGAAGPQFAPGSVPRKPSQGAVTGAIGAVLPKARACLGPDDPVSHASITFGSAGTVQSVRVSGGAAGKPAEGCIKTALSAAKLTPFAEPSYTARITVRH